MATTTAGKTQARTHTFNMRAFLSFAFAKMSDSVGDMIVTVAVTGIALAYILVTMPVFAFTDFPGLFIAGMMVQLFIRIVHRFDDHYTTDELAERMIEFEASVKASLDEIKRNI